MRPSRLGLSLLLLLLTAVAANADRETTADLLPTRYGIGLLAGEAYDPDHFGLVIVQGQMLVDYDRIFWHRAPKELFVKFELNGGITTDGRDRTLAAINMLALYYLQPDAASRPRTYIEAGIGLIYTDFHVEDQGLHFNFNPQAGIGVEIPLATGSALTTAVRLHHLSNGGLYKDNRGVNSALLMIGYLF